MKTLRRLYRYILPYKGWAIVAFGSMVIFAATQTVLMGLVRPLFDVVLVPPVHLEPDVLAYLQRRAEERGTSLSVLVNELLKKDIELIEAVRPVL